MTARLTVRLRTMLGLGSAALTAAVLVPATAAADGPPLSALTDRNEAGATKPVLAKPGELASPVLGVANLSGAPVKGAAVQIRVIEGLDLPRTFANCHYFVDSNLDGAWCQFDEELAVDGRYALAGFQVAVNADAIRADSVVFRWVTPEQVTAGGGIEAMAKRDSRTNQSVPGTQGTLRLEARDLPLPKAPHPIGFAFVKVVVPDATPTTTAPSTTAPTTTPPSSATPATAPTSPAAGANGGSGGGDGGGLPVTGSAVTTAAGIGVVLLIAGGAGFLVGRRRRNQFEA
jgi:LPXTG-motif cell wall-anchored protein